MKWLVLFTACVISLADGFAVARPGPDSNYNIAISGGGGSGPTFDANGSAGVGGSVGTTLSWTHTPVGTPSKVTVRIGNFDGTVTVSGVTYGGNAMTQLASAHQSVGGIGTYIFGLISPPSGAQTVVVTFSGTNAFAFGVSTTFTGGSGSTVFRNGAVGTGTTTNPTTTVSSATGDIVIDLVYNNSGNTETVAAAGQVLDVGSLNNISANNSVYTSRMPGAASTTPNWTQSGSTTWWTAAASVE